MSDIVIGLYVPPKKKREYEITIREDGEKIARRFLVPDVSMTFEQIIQLAKAESREAIEGERQRVHKLLNKRYKTPYPKTIRDYWLKGE